MAFLETQDNLHYFWKDSGALRTLENLDEDSFWSIMEDKDIYAHLKQEAFKVADLIARYWGSQKKPKSKIDMQTCENFDEDSFWSIMEDEVMHAHLKQEAYKVADLIARESSNQRTYKYKRDCWTPKIIAKQNFWTLMEDEAIHAHLRQEAFKVADMIARGWGSSSPDSLSRMEVESPAEISIPQLPFTFTPPPNTAKPSQPSQVRVSPKADEGKQRLQSLSSPEKTLVHIFKLLSSDDWQKKMYGLTSIQDLARNHPDILKATLCKVCVGVLEEVKNLRSMVSCAAMATLGEMYAHLQRTMDDMVEETGCALILKVSESNTFIQQQANLALDAMVQNCSPGHTMNVLLNAGLTHRSATVRASSAQHLSQLCDILGATRMLTGGKTFTKRFLIAVSKICVDAAADVRRHGYDVIQNISTHSAFQKQWKKAVPEKDRHSLEGIMKMQKGAEAKD